MEWPFTFVTEPGRTAVIQLCADVNICFVFHVFHLKKLPAALVALLTHDKVCLHGVNIKKYNEYASSIEIEIEIDFLFFCIAAIAVSCNETFRK